MVQAQESAFDHWRNDRSELHRDPELAWDADDVVVAK